MAYPNSHILRVDCPGTGWKRWVMLRSDAHHDNIHSLHDLERDHLEQARERDALIIDAGDIFCAMQGKGDPRGNYDALRPEHKTDRYLDALVATAAEFYRPYARNFALIGRGNHETAVLKHRGTDLTDRLTERLRMAGGVTMPGAYSGWVSLRFAINTTTRMSRTIHYYHGSGGGGPVTRGVIQSNRHAVNWPDADVIFSGHTHDGWILPIVRERLTEHGRPYNHMTWHIKTPTYKDETSGGVGWAVERGHNPKPLGCVWLELAYRSEDKAIHITPQPMFSAGPGLPQSWQGERPASDWVPAWMGPAGSDAEGGEGDA